MTTGREGHVCLWFDGDRSTRAPRGQLLSARNAGRNEEIKEMATRIPQQYGLDPCRLPSKPCRPVRPQPWQRPVDAIIALHGHRLKIRAYYTDTEAVYVAGLERWRAQLDAAIPTDPVGALANGAPAVVLPDPIGPEVEPPEIDPAA